MKYVFFLVYKPKGKKNEVQFFFYSEFIQNNSVLYLIFWYTLIVKLNVIMKDWIIILNQFESVT